MPNLVCAFGSCPAIPTDDREYCPCHRPEEILKRAINIVRNNFDLMIVGAKHNLMNGLRSEPDLLTRLREDIVYDLEHTV